MYKKDRVFCIKILKHYIETLSKILKDLGININTIPVLDVIRKNTHKVIGKRSFSNNQKIVKELGFTDLWKYETKSPQRVLDGHDYEVEPRAQRFLNSIQSAQDQGYAWGEAYDQALIDAGGPQ